VTMPVYPFGIEHAAEYFDEHTPGEASVDPQHLSDLCLAKVIGVPGWHGPCICHLSRMKTRQLE